MSLDQNFQVNLGGVIRLLSDHLYSGPEVYIRELLQNCVDAITARQHHDPSHLGSIRFELIGDDGSAPTLVAEDDGIGLSEEEVHQFLATIGQSSKSGEFSRDDFIGQFGIGLLSAFVVSDEITVITKSIREDSPPVEWKGRADGTYSVRLLEGDFDTGTRIYLRAKEGKEEFFTVGKVLGLLRHFGHHLPHQIRLVTLSGDVEVNEDPPWRTAQGHPVATSGDSNYLEYGREVFEIDFLDAIPLSSERGQVDGVAYVLPFAASPASRQSHRVYLKNMLLAESVDGLLPDWAFFVRCVVNSNQLRPNAARDSFYEDDALEQARAELGGCLRNYLMGLAENHPDRLQRIIALHYMPIKALAVDDDEFFRLFIDWLPFETSLGTMTLDDYCRDRQTIRYVSGLDQFRQISSVASAQGMCVFNGGYAYDTELLQRVDSEFPRRDVQRVEAGDLVQSFEDLSIEEAEQVFDLIKLADLVLQPYKCGAEARKFAPEDLPTLYTANESSSFMRSVDQSKDTADEMWSGILDSVAESAGSGAYAQLVFNFRNPLVRKLCVIDDKVLLKRIIEIMYLQSLLLGHYPLAAGERGILAGGLLGLIDHFID